MKTIPINVDKNATAKDYADPSKVYVFSIFNTIQGEGPFAGVPALFVRLAGCNIGAKEDCPWCDTKFDVAHGQPYSPTALARLIVDRAPRSGLVVVTGGEPLLQWPMLKHVIDDAMHLNWQIETNGLLLREDMIAYIKNRHVNVVVSPKVPHNRGVYRPLQPMFLRHDPVLNQLLSLKYVVEEPVNAGESAYDGVPTDAYIAAGAGFNVYVSGMTVYKRAPIPGEVASIWDHSLVDQYATADNYKRAASIAVVSGFRLSYQTHLFGAIE